MHIKQEVLHRIKESMYTKKSVYITNNAALKSTRWCIIAAYVWKLLYFPLCRIVPPDIMPIEQLRPIFFHTSGDVKCIPLFGEIIFLILAITAFIRLRSHTNQILHQAAILLIPAYIFEFIMVQTNVGVIAGNYLYEVTGYVYLPSLPSS